MSKKTGIIAAVVAVVLIVGGIAGYMYYKRTPTYTFNLIKTSVEKHDWDTFSKHVDTKNVISTSFDAFVESAMESEDDVDEDMKGMVSGFVKLLKPGIVEAMNDEVEQWVKTGEKKSSEKKDGSKDEQNAQSAADNMTKETGFDKSSFKGVAYTKDDGDFSLVGITIEDSQLKRDFTLELRMRQLDDGTWQILEISNLKDYLLELDKARKEKLAEVNKPIQDEIDQRVSVKNAKAGIVQADPFGFSQKLRVSLSVAVNSDKAIASFDGNIFLKAPDGKQTKIPFEFKSALKSGEQSIAIDKDLNPFIGGEAKLAKANLSQYSITTQLTKLTYTDGTTLELKTVLDEK